MLKMHPNCQCCDAELPPESADARICSFECTFCAACVDGRLQGRCPNCGGNFSVRPTRTGAALGRHPAATARLPLVTMT